MKSGITVNLLLEFDHDDSFCPSSMSAFSSHAAGTTRRAPGEGIVARPPLPPRYAAGRLRCKRRAGERRDRNHSRSIAGTRLAQHGPSGAVGLGFASGVLRHPLLLSIRADLQSPDLLLSTLAGRSLAVGGAPRGAPRPAGRMRKTRGLATGALRMRLTMRGRLICWLAPGRWGPGPRGVVGSGLQPLDDGQGNAPPQFGGGPHQVRRVAPVVFLLLRPFTFRLSSTIVSLDKGNKDMRPSKAAAPNRRPPDRGRVESIVSTAREVTSAPARRPFSLARAGALSRWCEAGRLRRIVRWAARRRAGWWRIAPRAVEAFKEEATRR